MTEQEIDQEAQRQLDATSTASVWGSCTQAARMAAAAKMWRRWASAIPSQTFTDDSWLDLQAVWLRCAEIAEFRVELAQL